MDSRDSPLALQRLLQVPLADSHPFLHRRRRQPFSGSDIMPDLPEDPGVPDGCAPDHDPIHPITILVFQRLLRTIDIPVAEDGNMDPGIILHLPNHRPLPFSLLQLPTTPPIARHPPNT